MFDLNALRLAVLEHGRVTRVVVADALGSTPREVGASILVWQDGQSGTIGGGALEWQAVQAARAGQEGMRRHALGPDLGQCCGGAVTLLFEHYEGSNLPQGPVVARGTGAMPLAVRRILDRARARGEMPAPQLVQGWMVEPAARVRRPVWIWGAGHVGRALVEVLSPLPDIALTWLDTSIERFCGADLEGVRVLPAQDLPEAMRLAPADALHLIVTYSHEIDLQLCHAGLCHGFGFAGVIGSKTKKARFDKRLMMLGHSSDAIARISCPIGDKSLGKSPRAIAIGVAAQILAFDKREVVAWEIPCFA